MAILRLYNNIEKHKNGKNSRNTILRFFYNVGVRNGTDCLRIKGIKTYLPNPLQFCKNCCCCCCNGTMLYLREKDTIVNTHVCCSSNKK